jgi:archaetidylinositol phosphate synthase
MPNAPSAFPGASRVEPRRQLQNLLAPLERRCLIWMAERMPAAVTSDHLTLLALASLLGAGVAFACARARPGALTAVVVALGLNWFGDSLDGTLARVRRRLRPRYGFYVDHVVDAIGTAALLAGLACSGFMAPVVALALLSAYFLVCIEVFLASQTVGVFTMSAFRVGPTELRVILAVGTLALYWHPTVSIAGQPVRLFDLGGLLGTAGLVLTALRSAVSHTRLLFEAERLAPEP